MTTVQTEFVATMFIIYLHTKVHV